MAALAMQNYKGAPDELFERARKAIYTPESAALMLAAVNKLLAEIAPGEEPYAAAKRLTAERDDRGIEAGYRHLNYYYEDSLDPKNFAVSYEGIDHEEFIDLGKAMLRILREGIA